MSKTVIRVREIMLPDGEVQTHFHLDEPLDVAQAQRSHIFQFDPDAEPYRRLSAVPPCGRNALADDLVRTVGQAVYDQLVVHPGVHQALDRGHEPQGSSWAGATSTGSCCVTFRGFVDGGQASVRTRLLANDGSAAGRPWGRSCGPSGSLRHRAKPPLMEV